VALDRSISEVVDLISCAKRIVALSGAGISTASGIPDFRSPESGLWNKVSPYLVASIQGFRLRPKAFYNWLRPLAVKIREAQPNAAHMALARLEEMGLLRVVITQNVDGLHQMAGSQRVLELHGNSRRVTCVKCGMELSSKPFIERFIEDGKVPRCPGCKGVMKPNVVLFGELLPVRTLLEAEAEAEACDLMLVVGSSLLIAPASELPSSTQRSGAKLVIINLQPTPVDTYASVVIREDVVKALPRIVRAVAKRLSRSSGA